MPVLLGFRAIRLYERPREHLSSFTRAFRG